MVAAKQLRGLVTLLEGTLDTLLHTTAFRCFRQALFGVVMHAGVTHSR
jgi:hypothetical protein